MKKLGAIYKYFITMVLILALVGCQAKREVTREEPRETPTTEADPRGFDPLELPQDTEVIPVKYPKSGDIVGQASFVEVTTDRPDTTRAVSVDDAEIIDTLNNQAFRVQLLTSKVYGDARWAYQVAEEIFDRPVYLDYEVPYYKVRVGSFADRDQAEDYVMRAKAAGYSNAWVVAVNVRVKEMAPLYEEPLPLEETDTLYYETQEIIDNDQP